MRGNAPRGNANKRLFFSSHCLIMFSNLLFRFAESHRREGMDAGTVESVTVEFQMPTKFTMGKLVPTENLAYRVYSTPDTIFDSTTLYKNGVDGFSQSGDSVSITVEEPSVGVSGRITADVEAILLEGEAEAVTSERESVPEAGGVDVTPELLGMTSLGSVGTVTVQVSSFASS